jgi:hypothetical protein
LLLLPFDLGYGINLKVKAAFPWTSDHRELALHIHGAYICGFNQPQIEAFKKASSVPNWYRLVICFLLGEGNKTISSALDM